MNRLSIYERLIRKPVTGLTRVVWILFIYMTYIKETAYVTIVLLNTDSIFCLLMGHAIIGVCFYLVSIFLLSLVMRLFTGKWQYKSLAINYGFTYLPRLIYGFAFFLGYILVDKALLNASYVKIIVFSVAIALMIFQFYLRLLCISFTANISLKRSLIIMGVFTILMTVLQSSIDFSSVQHEYMNYFYFEFPN